MFETRELFGYFARELKKCNDKWEHAEKHHLRCHWVLAVSYFSFSSFAPPPKKKEEIVKNKLSPIDFTAVMLSQKV